MSEVLLHAKSLHKSYKQGAGELHILKGLDLEVKQGEALCIAGASGAGKSTLLHILGTLDRPTSGEVLFEGESLFAKNDDELARFRNHKMGFVFQFHYLLSEFTAYENILMPAQIGKLDLKKARRRADELLSILGLSNRKSHFPSELSGGEQQRVAIARALVCNPLILFADEPTGNLDSENSQKIQELFFKLKEELGLTLIAVSHDSKFAARFPRDLRMKDGAWVQE